MVNKPKAKGTAAETRVVNFLKEAGLNAMRVVMKGSKDEGDVHIIGKHGHPVCIIEVKAGRQTQNVSRKQREDWLTETQEEAEHTGSLRGYLVIAKHGSSVRDYLVWDQYGREFWYLDEFADFANGGF